MEIRSIDKPSLIDGQYNDTIDKYKLFYNPNGHYGITLVDQDTERLIKFCNGKNNISEIAALDRRSTQIVPEEIQSLAESEVLFISDMFSEELKNPSRTNRKISCWMHLTNRCNLSCTYCYIKKSAGDMSPELGKSIIDNMIASCKKQGIENINIKFAGGEPLLRFDLLKELVNYAKTISCGINFSFTILTNATMVTDEIASFIIGNRIGVGVSLDGIGEVNDRDRHYANDSGSFQSVIKGISILEKFGKIPSIMVTISEKNFRDLLDTTKYLLSKNYRFRFSFQKDYESGKPELLNHLPDLIDILNKCYDYIEDHLPKTDIFSIHSFCDVNFNRPSKRICSAGENFFSIGHDLSIGACGMGLLSPFSKFDDNKDMYQEVKNMNQYLISCSASNYPECKKCPWRTSCAAGCPLQSFSTFGRYDVSSPYCEVYKNILPRILRIKAMQLIDG